MSYFFILSNYFIKHPNLILYTQFYFITIFFIHLFFIISSKNTQMSARNQFNPFSSATATLQPPSTTLKQQNKTHCLLATIHKPTNKSIHIPTYQINLDQQHKFWFSQKRPITTNHSPQINPPQRYQALTQHHTKVTV